MSKLSKKAKQLIKDECNSYIEEFREDLHDSIDGLKTCSEKELEEFIYENLKARIDSMGDCIEMAVRGKGES